MPLKISGLLPQGLPGRASGKEPTCQCRRGKRHGFNPWAGKIPEERMAMDSSILAWRILWTEEPVSYGPWDHKQLDMTEAT